MKLKMKHVRIFVVIVGLIWGCSMQGLAQSHTNAKSEIKKIEKHTITGKISDEYGDPLIGASVVLLDGESAVITDADGNFSIYAPNDVGTLQISYVGMKTKDVKFTKSTKYLSVKLDPQENIFDEVVVTGYQNLKRENATGAYQSISAKDLQQRAVSSLSENLEGRVPGLVKDGKSTSNNEDAFTIRGTSTFQARTSPLVVVDGLPIEGGMSTVNPYDIENITILKDASAAAIYGARASNGVIVVTTKSAKDTRLQVDFNADLTISEKQDYSNYKWASAAQMIELEKHNFQAMLDEPTGGYLNTALANYNEGRMHAFSPVMRQLLGNYVGAISDTDLNNTLNKWSKNNYRKEWQDVHDRTQVLQQYNLSVRATGTYISSSLTVNYTTDNMGVQKERSNALTLKYRGDIKATSWLDIAVGVNILNTRTKTHQFGSNNYAGINSFQPYMSMYNDDGSLARMEAEIYPYYDVFDNALLELKDCTFNLNEEMDRNFSNERYNNTRAFVHTTFKPLPGWTISGQFQYEDINSHTQNVYENDSYYARRLYSAYTTGGHMEVWEVDPNFSWGTVDWTDPNLDITHLGQKLNVYDLPTVHHVPDGAIQQTNNYSGQYYTLRAQTNYRKEISRNFFEVLGGFEYRSTHYTTDYDILYGWDDATQTNSNKITDWAFITNPTVGVFGDEVYGSLTPNIDFFNSETLHRYYSIYFTGNYVYDSRYAVSGSYRVDKTDLFGTDPKFRGRPLWSIGASWNVHNEKFLRQNRWVNALKLRMSYGLTGNIDTSVSSYLTATISSNPFTNDKMGTLDTPPNDQLRWEKTATWNFGADFALLQYRLNGSIDYYRKSGSDLLTLTDIDHTTGWTNGLTINNGKMVNHGLELQLDGQIISPSTPGGFGFNLGLNFAYNKNEVTKVSKSQNSGYEYLRTALHEGYPMSSLFAFRYAGFVEKDGVQRIGWYDHNGEIQSTSIGSANFTIDDAVYCGTAIPVFSGAIIPQLTWNGFTLSAMLNYYGGHKMRIGYDDWYTGGSYHGYGTSFGDSAVPASALDYWNGDTTVPGNGIASNTYDTSYYTLRDDLIVKADYMKLRSITLSYNLKKSLCRKMGLNDLRLRIQMNNICTWAANDHGIDPEAWSGGRAINKRPRSYTMSLFFNI